MKKYTVNGMGYVVNYRVTQPDDVLRIERPFSS